MLNRYVSATTNSTENFFVINTLVQFNTNSWGKTKKFKNHIGLSLSPQYQHTKDQTTVKRSDGTTEEDAPRKFRHLDIWPGIDQSFTYDANSRLQLSSHLFFEYYPTGPTAFKSANAQLGLHIGASYKTSP